MSRFEHKSIEWLADRVVKINARIADRTIKFERALAAENRSDEKLVKELSEQLFVLSETDPQRYIDWSIKNKNIFMGG
jgi:hemerythrin superfamily protein